MLHCRDRSLIPGQGTKGFPGGSVIKKLPANAGEVEFNPWVGKTSGGGSGKQFQYSCLENPMNRVWRATVHEAAESDTAEHAGTRKEGPAGHSA